MGEVSGMAFLVVRYFFLYVEGIDQVAYGVAKE